MPNATSNQSPAPKPRGWSLVAAGFLLLALALVVVASIGLAALLLQLRMRKDVDGRIHAPIWLNVLGLIFAIGAVIADFLHANPNFMIVAALGAVVCFAVSGVVVLDAFRKRKS